MAKRYGCGDKKRKINYFSLKGVARTCTSDWLVWCCMQAPLEGQGWILDTKIRFLAVSSLNVASLVIADVGTSENGSTFSCVLATVVVIKFSCNLIKQELFCG